MGAGCCSVLWLGEGSFAVVRVPVLGHVLKHVPRHVLRHVLVRHVLEYVPGHVIRHVLEHVPQNREPDPPSPNYIVQSCVSLC